MSANNSTNNITNNANNTVNNNNNNIRINTNISNNNRPLFNELNYSPFFRPNGISAFHNHGTATRITHIEPDTAIRLFNSINRPRVAPQIQQQEQQPSNSGRTTTTSSIATLISASRLNVNATTEPASTANPCNKNENNNNIGSNVLSFISVNSEENICRICRQKRSDTQLLHNACKCTGTMGYIHLKCLHRWIRYRQKTTCEICHSEFRIPPEKRNYGRLFKSFFNPQYIGLCLKHILNLVSITPLIYFTVNQMVYTIESVNEDGAIKVLFVGPVMLLATSLYLFLYFEWAMSCIFRIKNILNHWWNFGDQNFDEDFPTIDQQESNRGFFDLEF